MKSISRLTFHAIVAESFAKFVDDDEKHGHWILHFLSQMNCQLNVNELSMNCFTLS